jgi:hypothetical protein
VVDEAEDGLSQQGVPVICYLPSFLCFTVRQGCNSTSLRSPVWIIV